ncbi:DNA cytosine methyltransferase, partial [Liquorilactobacillus sp.]
NDPMHYAPKLSKINLKRIRQSKPGGTWHDWDEELLLNAYKKKTGSSYTSIYGRMKWDEPAPTITTKFYGYGNGRFGHPEQDRAISFREGAALQTFPKSYIFFNSKHFISGKDLGIMIGNAVPVKLAESIGKSIIGGVQIE